ncbi:hypothetical protein VTL71DRAFT_9798 [Oculimacula yallundae]|uniref:Uncharacterized protein n=1 Tax=Oculimacula yallundae TaxID=86028 RepID=A0ABR4BRW9_9HELO
MPYCDSADFGPCPVPADSIAYWLLGRATSGSSTLHHLLLAPVPIPAPALPGVPTQLMLNTKTFMARNTGTSAHYRYVAEAARIFNRDNFQYNARTRVFTLVFVMAAYWEWFYGVVIPPTVSGAARPQGLHEYNAVGDSQNN